MRCSSGKIGYANYDLARQAMYMAVSYSDSKRIPPKRVYYCHECERYHLTSKPKNTENNNE